MPDNTDTGSAAEKVSLKEHLLSVINERDGKWEQRMLALKSELSMMMGAAEKAILKAEVAAEKRFDSVNEFRQALSTQQITLVTRTETDIRFDALNQKMDAAFAQLQQQKGSAAAMSIVWGVVAVVLSLVISGAGLVIAVMRH